MLISVLMGCSEQHTYSYLMQHPAVLKNDLTDCQSSIQKTKEQAKQCEVVMNAAANVMTILNEQQQDPEKFGQRVLDMETQYEQSKSALHQAQEALENLKKNQAAAADIAAAQTKLDQQKQACDEQLQEIKIFLAVIGINSPE